MKMLASMPTQGCSDASMAIRMEAYIENLSDIPPEKVADAIKRFMQGDIGDGKFAPTIAQLRQSILDPCFGQHDLRFTPDDRLTNEQYWRKRHQLKVWGSA
jgi:hypothetical protein